VRRARATIPPNVGGRLLTVGGELWLVHTTAPAATRESWPQRIEADWLLAEEVAAQGSVPEPLTTKAETKGGCDAIAPLVLRG